MDWSNLVLVKDSIADAGHEHHRDQERNESIDCHFQGFVRYMVLRDVGQQCDCDR